MRSARVLRMPHRMDRHDHAGRLAKIAAVSFWFGLVLGALCFAIGERL